MLSKLIHFARRNPGDLVKLRSCVDVRPALNLLGEPGAPYVAVSGGTLGVGFISTVHGRKCFLKTYASARGKPNLEKEIRILSHLYGESLSVRRIEEQEVDASSRVWLVMDALDTHDSPLSPGETIKLIDAYQLKLASLPPDVLDAGETLGELIDDAKQGLVNLAHADEIEPLMFDELRARLNYLSREWEGFASVTAHGDCGPRNIMSIEGHPAVIDWEDAFRGVVGYDYLYWLTFFENRRYYCRDILGHTSLGTDAEVAMLAMILVLKSDLSRRANNLAGNQLTIKQRIGEVLALA